jgi:hypothetical protein
MPNDASTKSEYQDVYELNNTYWTPFNEQACLDNDFYLKAQHSIDEMNKANDQNRILHTIDKIGRQVNLVHGYEIRNRHILKIGEQGNFDQQEDQACNQHTGVIMSQMASRGGYDVLSEAFKWGTLVQGSNLVEQWRDREGLIQYGRLGFNQFLIDAGTTKSDLSDCGDILTGQWVSSEKAKMLVPTRADEIDKITPLTSSPRWRFQSQPTMNNKAGKRLFEQWWHRTTEEIPIVINRVTGEQMTFADFKTQFADGDSKLANRIIKETLIPGTETPQLIKVRDIKDRIELKILVDDELVWTGDNPTKLRDYNYSWMHGNWCPECPRSELKLQSFVRGQRDPQRMYNRKVNQAMDIIESQMQGFRTVRDKYLRNPEDAYKSGQGAVLHANDEMPDEMRLSDIFTQTAASEVPQSIFQMLSVIDKDQTETGGLNQEIFGSDDKNVEISGVLAQYRTGQALTGQAWMFQILREAKRDMGKKQVQIVQLNYPPQLIQKMINEPPVEGFYNEDLTRFDCSPTEGLLTDSQQNMYYQELKDLLKTFPEMFTGIITPQMLVAASPMQFKTPTLKAIEQAAQGRQQQQQQAQQQAQIDQQLQQAVTGLQVAQGIESLADAAEKRSQIPLNNAKTVSEINKNAAGPIIDLIKEQVKLEIAQSKQAQTAGQGV